MQAPANRIFKNSNYVIAIGSSLMIALMISLALSAMSHMAVIKQNMETITHERSERINMLTSMRRIVRERSLTMYAIYLTQDEFDRDAEFMRFHAMAEQFIKLRLKLVEAGILPQQEDKFKEAMQLINKTAPLQSNLVDKLIDQTTTDVYQIMSAIDLPMEKKILALFDDLIAIEQDYTRDALRTAQDEFSEARTTMIGIGSAAFLLSIVITLLVIRRTSQIESELFEAKEEAEVTLHAIGDAVITTNAQGEVVYLNPAAERLTGWTLKEAEGKALKEVYHLRAEDDEGYSSAYQNNADGKSSEAHSHSVLVNRNQSEHIITDTSSTLRKNDGTEFGHVIVSRDVTFERELTKQLTWQACHDSLTHLVNRREFESILQYVLKHQRYLDKKYALLYMDLDQFKLVNDTCGHSAGDELLKQISVLLRTNTRDADTLARLGGDEFGLILEGCPVDNALSVAKQIIAAVSDFRFVWNGKIFTLGISIGLVMMGEFAKDANTLLSSADSACYIAKEKGRNRVWLHHLADKEVAQHRGEMEWASRITSALENNEFTLYFQKVVPLAEGAVGTYYEFLVRIIAEDGRIIAPMAFIPAAERYGTMLAIDRWIVRNAFAWIREQGDNSNPKDIYAINLSGKSLCDSGFLIFCIDELTRSGVNAKNICFEITETSAVSNWTHANEFVTVLKEQGCLFALDDFGSGMSSFGYLKNLDVDFLKIDGTFIRDMLNDPIDRAMVTAINQIGHVLGTKTIAEFVEDDDTRVALIELGIDYAQGFGIHKPQPLDLPVTKQAKNLSSRLKHG